VDYPHSAFPGKGYGETRFGYGVHRGGDYRDVEFYVFGYVCGNVHLVRQDLGVIGNQKNVVEG